MFIPNEKNKHIYQDGKHRKIDEVILQRANITQDVRDGLRQAEKSGNVAEFMRLVNLVLLGSKT